MRTALTGEMVEVAGRIAKDNGVSVHDVLAKYSQGVRKRLVSFGDFFWGDGDISLNFSGAAKNGAGEGLPTAARAAKRNGGRAA